MSTAVKLVRALTDPANSLDEKRGLADDFSHEFGWRPNDLLEVPRALPAANLVVEHGLDNAAMLSFLPSSRELQDIRVDERRDILGLSYNSLVDWHVFIDQKSIECFYNRSDPPKSLYKHQFGQSDYSSLRKETFEKAVGLTPNPNVQALDGALLDTISTWKRLLRVELGSSATATSISALFNAIILARAVEDFCSGGRAQSVISTLREITSNTDVCLTDAIESSIAGCTGYPVPSKLIDRSKLEPFDELSQSSKTRLIDAFYRHDGVPYAYDFSVMSKFALSKIYERYVSVMQNEDSVQIPMFPTAQEETWNKILGGIYTPQYIASFFARYLSNNMPNQHFIESRILDPACGSGIFLRAVMERKLLVSDDQPNEIAQNALDSLLGVDVDENAVAAARLSLSLLHLAAHGELPQDVPLLQRDSLEWFGSNEAPSNVKFDAVLMNPPFVRTELQSDDIRRSVSESLDGIAKGKLDLYTAFVVKAIRSLRSGGFGCFVVPESLLTSEILKSLRDWIRDKVWIRVIADLSAIRVFNANVYVVLLVVQRKSDSELAEPPLSLIRCRHDVGLALDKFLDGVHRKTDSYMIFNARQSALSRSTWSVIAPEQAGLLAKIEALPVLAEIANVRQGSITGDDKVFNVGVEEVPEGEETVYRPLLRDRSIGRYALPQETELRMFYPYVDGNVVDSALLETKFPKTWERLNKFRDSLSSRKSITKSGLQWWQPTRPRPPNVMLAPKIVAPAIALLPRFGVDLHGKWIVSHSPVIQMSDRYSDPEMMLVLAAILNSGVTSWYIDLNASKYGHGYNRITVALLRRVPIPDLELVPKACLRRVTGMVRELIDPSSPYDHHLVEELDTLS